MKLSRRAVVATALIAPPILRRAVAADGNRAINRFPPHSFTQLKVRLA
jgi:hypothetical protein